MGFSPSPGAKLGLFFAHCSGQRTFPRASACGIFTDGMWYSGTSEKLALTTSGGNDALSPALWESPQRCVSVRRWVCAVLGPARHSLARVQRFARRRAHMLSEDCTSTAPVHCLAQCISWVVARTEHFCMSTEHVSQTLYPQLTVAAARCQRSATGIAAHGAIPISVGVC